MLKVYFKSFCALLQVLIIALLITSCASTKKTKYFQNIPDSGALKTIAKAEYTEPKIEIDDILTVLIQVLDPTAAINLNAGNTNSLAVPALSALSTAPAPVSTNGINTSSGYLVDKEGFITISVLGKIKVLGLTTTQARSLIQNITNKYYKDATVTVRFANFKINVDGEVLRPGSYIIPNEKVSVLDALSMAGDLTIYGKRENVLLIRENEDGTKTPYRINLKKTDFMSAPYFYLKQNDYIYVEPSKSKAASTDANAARYYTIVGSILSIIAIIATRK